MAKKLTLLTVLALAVILRAQSVLAGPPVLTLTEAVTVALEENPNLRALENSVEADSEEIGIARSALLPKLVLEERFTRTDNPTASFSAKLNQERFTNADFAVETLNDPDAISDFQTSITLEQPVFVKKAYAGMDVARKNHSARLKELDRGRETVAFEVTRTYLRAQAAAEFVAVAEKSVEDAREHSRIARLRYENDLGLYSDVLRAETRLRDAEGRLVTARKNYRVTRRALGLLLGMDNPVEVTDDETALPLRDLEAYSEAAATRSDVESMERMYDTARAGVKLAKSDYYPTVGLGGTYQMNDHEVPFGAEGTSWTVGAFLRWNIFDGTLRHHRASKARYKAAETAERLRGLKKSVSFGVHEAWLAVEEAGQKVDLAEAALESAREGERLVRKRYENSLSPIVDLLDAQTALDRARAEYVASRKEYLIAVAGLAHQGGTILADLGLGEGTGE